MSFTKFTHTLLKHHQASQRPSMECTERKRVLKNANVDLQK